MEIPVNSLSEYGVLGVAVGFLIWAITKFLTLFIEILHKRDTTIEKKDEILVQLTTEAHQAYIDVGRTLDKHNLLMNEILEKIKNDRTAS